MPYPRAVGRYVVWLSLPRVLSRGGMHAGAGPLIVLPSKTEVSRGARVPRVPPRPRAGLLSKTMQLPRVGAVLDFQHRVGSRPLGARMTQSDRLHGGSFCVRAAVLPVARRVAAGVAPRDMRGAGSQPSYVVEAPSVAVAGQKSSLARGFPCPCPLGAVRCGRRRLRPWQV